MPPEFFIRPAEKEDLQRVHKLAHRIWPVCFKGVIGPGQIDNMLERIYSVENLEREVAEEGHRFWLAYMGAEPVGYVSSYKKNDTIWIKKLYVLPELQGKGLGAAMMAEATKHFTPAKELRLMVNRENVTAQQFYKRKGFACVDEARVRMGDNWFVDFVFAKPLAA